MDDRLALNALRDMLRTELTDPYTQYSSTSRQWIHTDIILPSATFPRIQIGKKGETLIKNISIGFDYWEERTLPVDIWFKTKTGFKYKIEDNSYLSNEEFIKYYQQEILDAIKTNSQFFHDNYRFYVRLISNDEPKQDEEFQQYYGRVTVNLIYYRK